MTEEPGKKRRRLIGMGFVIAFMLSTATIILTGLNVRAPGTAGTHDAAEPQPSNPALPGAAPHDANSADADPAGADLAGADLQGTDLQD